MTSNAKKGAFHPQTPRAGAIFRPRPLKWYLCRKQLHSHHFRPVDEKIASSSGGYERKSTKPWHLLPEMWQVAKWTLRETKKEFNADKQFWGSRIRNAGDASVSRENSFSHWGCTIAILFSTNFFKGAFHEKIQSQFIADLDTPNRCDAITYIHRRLAKASYLSFVFTLRSSGKTADWAYRQMMAIMVMQSWRCLSFSWAETRFVPIGLYGMRVVIKVTPIKESQKMYRATTPITSLNQVLPSSNLVANGSILERWGMHRWSSGPFRALWQPECEGTGLLLCYKIYISRRSPQPGNTVWNVLLHTKVNCWWLGLGRITM